MAKRKGRSGWERWGGSRGTVGGRRAGGEGSKEKVGDGGNRPGVGIGPGATTGESAEGGGGGGREGGQVREPGSRRVGREWVEHSGGRSEGGSARRARGRKRRSGSRPRGPQRAGRGGLKNLRGPAGPRGCGEAEGEGAVRGRSGAADAGASRTVARLNRLGERGWAGAAGVRAASERGGVGEGARNGPASGARRQRGQGGAKGQAGAWQASGPRGRRRMCRW